MVLATEGLPGNSTANWVVRKRGIFSDDQRVIFEIVNESVVCCLLGLFGMLSNLINMIVFVKQGLNNTINIGLFGLSFSDFAGVSTLVWFGICKNPFFQSSDIPVMPGEFSYLTGAWAHGVFARITCWHTAYATAERCLCIAVPLKCKRIITPFRTTVIICSIYLMTFISVSPQYGSAYIDWKYFETKNRTLLGLVFRQNREQLEGISFLLHASLGLLSFTAVIIFTAILVIKLRQRTRWRKKSASEIDVNEGISDKDRKTVKMILLIAIVLIICYTPGLMNGVLNFAEPEFSGIGRYYNEFLVAWSFANVFESVNSSINILFFYTMSSKYRATLIEMSTWRKKSKLRKVF